VNDDDFKDDTISYSSAEEDTRNHKLSDSPVVNFSQPLISTATNNIKKAGTRVASLSDDENKNKKKKKQ